MYVSFHAVNDFNDTEIITTIMVPASTSRWEQEIQIYDDNINEAEEVFNVSLTVEGNFSVEYRTRTAVCRIPESDRKHFCKHVVQFIRCFVPVESKFTLVFESSSFHYTLHIYTLPGYHHDYVLVSLYSVSITCTYHSPVICRNAWHFFHFPTICSY